MKREKTAKARNIFVAAAVILVITGSGANAQQTLGDLVAEGGFGWMIGKWQATTDEGDKVELEYKWQLDKHLVTMQLKIPDNEFVSMIFYKPVEDQVLQVTVDKRGGSGKGVWEPHGNKAILKYEHTSADWETNKMGIAHSKIDDSTMKWEIYEMYSSGELSTYPSYTVEFKRQKKSASAPTSQKETAKK
jgi:hypothetical protein